MFSANILLSIELKSEKQKAKASREKSGHKASRFFPVLFVAFIDKYNEKVSFVKRFYSLVKAARLSPSRSTKWNETKQTNKFS